MKIVEFLEAVEAQLVGGRVKALIDGVHHFVAEMVEGSPVLTAAGQAAKEELESRAPTLVQEIAGAPAAVAEAAKLASDPLLTGAATGDAGGVVQAVVKGAAEKAAVEGVDALLDGITAKATRTKAKATQATS